MDSAIISTVDMAKNADNYMVRMTKEEVSQFGHYQIENGNFFKIANRIQEDLMRYPFTIRQRCMIDVVIRMTYGYRKKTARIGVGLFAKLTGIKRNHCHVALRELIESNVLCVDGNHTWTYNKYSSEWNIKPRCEASQIKPESSTKLGPNSPKSGLVPSRDQTAKNDQKQSQVGTKSSPKSGLQIKTTINTDKDNISSSDDDGAEGELKKSNPAKINGTKRDNLPSCPQEKILDLWKQHCFFAPQPRIWGDDRRAKLAARWKKGFTLTHRTTGELLYTDLESGINWWGRFFAYIAQNKILSNAGWFSIDWMLKPANFNKIVDGNYEKDWQK